MKRFFEKYLPVLIVFAISVAFSLTETSCKKEQLLKSGGELKFSTDTLAFDTVFTKQGSFTLQMKIYNPQNQKVVISSVRLANGSTSQFHLNVDGFAGNNIPNIEIAAKDSAYVFATVNVNPDNSDAPFIIEDDLIATLNGAEYKVHFTAYGQNAHYIKDSVLSTQAWGGPTDKKPYVLLGYSIVDTGQTLTIEAGTRIYMHADARMFIEGTLITKGTKTDSVIFQGDRLDRKYFGYEGYPGEWGGLYFDGISKGNSLKHTIIQNCGNGAFGAVAAAIQLNPGSQVRLDQCTIQNSIGYGIISFGGDLRADNCLIHSCGAQALAIVKGGKDTLNNCTIGLYGNNKVTHTDNPACIILNYYKIDDTHIDTGSLSAILNNCTIYGSLENELVIDSIAGVAAGVKLNHCDVKANAAKIPGWVQQQNVTYNADPMFVDVSKGNYRVKAGSPLIDAGISVPLLSPNMDIDDVVRPQLNGWDIGCYEQ